MNIFGGGVNDDDLDNVYKRGVWDMARESYREVILKVIRPPRRQYSLKDLGPSDFPFQKQLYRRVDFEATNIHSHTLCCSIWGSQDLFGRYGEMPPPALAPTTSISIELPTSALRFRSVLLFFFF